MKPKLFFDKTIYAYHCYKENHQIVVQLHIDDPHDDKKTIDISTRFAPYWDEGLSYEELTILCLQGNGIDPNLYETKNF